MSRPFYRLGLSFKTCIRKGDSLKEVEQVFSGDKFILVVEMKNLREKAHPIAQGVDLPLTFQFHFPGAHVVSFQKTLKKEKPLQPGESRDFEIETDAASEGFASVMVGVPADMKDQIQILVDGIVERDFIGHWTAGFEQTLAITHSVHSIKMVSRTEVYTLWMLAATLVFLGMTMAWIVAQIAMCIFYGLC